MELIRINLQVLFLLMVIILLNSCKKDDNSTKSENSITIDGRQFQVTSASIMGVSTGDFGHAAVILNKINGTRYETIAVDFDYEVGKSVDGDYAYPQSGDMELINAPLSIFTIVDESSIISTLHLETGTMKITKNAEAHYTVIIELMMTDGTVIKGTYSGPFTEGYTNM